MSKELESFEIIRQSLSFVNHENEIINDYEEECNIIEKALKRLEAIDNANPSEALKCLENWYNTQSPRIKMYEYELHYRVIKQALIQAEHDKKLLKIYEQENENLFNNIVDKEKKELAFDIIKEKCLTNCNLALVKDNVHYENYCKEFEYFLNKYNESPNGFEITKEDLLTEEEFDLLKEVLG